MFDLVAINRHQIRLIQVKSNRAPSPAEREAMELFEVPPQCSKEIWIWHDRVTEPVINTVK
jgi:hypothetical protein